MLCCSGAVLHYLCHVGSQCLWFAAVVLYCSVCVMLSYSVYVYVCVMLCYSVCVVNSCCVSVCVVLCCSGVVLFVTCCVTVVVLCCSGHCIAAFVSC